MATSKSKLQILTKGKSTSPVKLGVSTSSKSASPLLQVGAKKTYKKKDTKLANAIPSFGQTGLTGES
jgi:hypothetical protein